MKAGADTAGERLPVASKSVATRVLFSSALGHKRVLLGSLAASLGSAILDIVPVYVFGVLVDSVVSSAPPSTMVWVVAALIGSAIFGGVFAGVSTALVGRLGDTVLADLRERAVERALSLPVETIERVGKGDVLSRVGDDVEVVTKAAANVVPETVSATLLVVMSMAAMGGLDWRLGLAGLCALPMYAIALRWYLSRSGPLYAQERIAMGVRAQSLMSSLHGARTVRAYRRESEHIREIDDASAAARDLGKTVFRLFARFVGRENRAEWFGLSLILVVGFFLVRADTVSLGAATTAALLFHRLFGPLGMIMFLFDELQSAGAALARIVGVVTVPSESGRQVSRVGDEYPAGSLRLEGISHSYSGVDSVLRGVDLVLAPGTTVALVGSTGAGKSTLAAVAAELITPSEGTVLVDGSVAMVTQEAHVFSGTVVDDVLLGRPDAEESDVIDALRRVGALEWVQTLPDGIRTAIGEGGTSVTTYRAQQLALARILLLDPAVIVLDEATAEAGSAGARDLDNAAATVLEGRTGLVVAHRLNQAQLADRVVVLEHGRIVEDGSHEDLRLAGGRYAQLWSAWKGEKV